MNNGAHVPLPRLERAPIHKDWDIALALMGSPDLEVLLTKGYEPIGAYMGLATEHPSGRQVPHATIVLRKKNSPVHLE